MQPVKLRPIPASEFVGFPQPFKELLQSSGGVAVNDKLLPIWNLLFSILLLFGGRGGGKSEAVCDKLIDECLNEEYFKCYYGRKVFDTVRGSCFATLIYCIKKSKLEHLFTFSEAEHSSMIITCKANGNKFIPFGSDKADKIKSIKDPTHIWGEEFDQFTFNDFKELYPTLRTIRGANRFVATFNTHGVMPNHWLLKVFFPELYQGDDKNDVEGVDLLKGKDVLKVFINFTDNFFIDQESYKQTLWLAAAGNFATFEGIANGAWGVVVNDSPWAYAFDRQKHVSNGLSIPHPVWNRRHPIYLSWDFNRNPMCCNVIQHYDDTVFVLEVIKIPNTGVDAMCDYILSKYPGALFIVTGDYSGNTPSSLFQEEVTHYSLIKNYLNLGDGQFEVEINPKLVDNATLINTILFYYKVVIHGRDARPLIFDMENVKKAADGTIVKTDRNDPAQQSDSLDGFRYFCNRFLKHYRPSPEDVKKSMQAINMLKGIKQTATAKALADIEQGASVMCSKEEYTAEVRAIILKRAEQWILGGDVKTGHYALNEVERLDKLFA